MRPIYFLLACLLILPFAVWPGRAEAALYRTLQEGDSGEDVFLLQKILNSDSVTRIATVGPGSPGAETAYFGSLTKAAVARFQEKYAGSILWPVGLKVGTGYVGPKTMEKLNQLALGAGMLAEPAASRPVVSIPPPPPPIADDTNNEDERSVSSKTNKA